jgi:hypothetical protein
MSILVDWLSRTLSFSPLHNIITVSFSSRGEGQLSFRVILLLSELSLGSDLTVYCNEIMGELGLFMRFYYFSSLGYIRGFYYVDYLIESSSSPLDV